VNEEVAQFHYHLTLVILKSTTTKAKEALALLDRKIDTLVNNAGIGIFNSRRIQSDLLSVCIH
jgi:3-oxoacyl-[acyl-carrier protein] reductase